MKMKMKNRIDELSQTEFLALDCCRCPRCASNDLRYSSYIVGDAPIFNHDEYDFNSVAVEMNCKVCESSFEITFKPTGFKHLTTQQEIS